MELLDDFALIDRYRLVAGAAAENPAEYNEAALELEGELLRRGLGGPLIEVGRLERRG